MDQLLSLTVSGLTVGMIYALIALGYTMVYGVLEFINFAHGEVFTVGGYIAALFLIWSGVNDGTPFGAKVAFFALALVASIALTAGLGWLIERLAYRPLRGASRIIPLLSAIGVSLILQNLIIVVVGPNPVIMPTSVVPSGFITIGNTRIRILALIIIAVSIVLMGALTWLIKGTRIGKAMRATSQDMEAAEMMGIDTNKTISFTFVVGSGLAAIGGFLVAMFYGSLRFDTGFLYGLKAFTAAVLGGIGNIPGAVVGALILGLAENYGVGLHLAQLAWIVLAGAALGLYVQMVRAPRRRLAHIVEGKRTPEYEREVLGNYRFTPVVAVRRVLGPRTDALLDVSARHAIRLMIGNVALLAIAAVFLVNGAAKFSTQWQHVISFATLIVVLMFRPSGLFGDSVQEKV